MTHIATFVNFCGLVVSETRLGTTRDKMLDPLGSVIGEYDDSQNVTGWTEYWPYGEIASETGTLLPSPLKFVGGLGYFRDRIATFLTYIRARWYYPWSTRWTTVDPLWPGESAYGYALARPTTIFDPSGMFSLPCAGCALCLGAAALAALLGCLGRPDGMAQCILDWLEDNVWAYALIAACLITCTACVGPALSNFLRNLIKPKPKPTPAPVPAPKPVPPPRQGVDCLALLAAYKAGCSDLNDIDKRNGTCNDSDNCTTLGLKMAHFSRCAAARRLYKAKCVPKCFWDAGHDTAIKKNTAEAALCSALFAKKCSKWK